MNPDGGPSQRENKQLIEMTSFGPGDKRVAEAVGNRRPALELLQGCGCSRGLFKINRVNTRQWFLSR